MTGAEIRTLRDGLGLSAQALADLVGVSLRAVQGWESERSAPRTSDVADTLGRLDNLITRAVAEFLAAIEAHSWASPVLLRYSDPADVPADIRAALGDHADLAAVIHGALVSRTREAVALRGRLLRVVWFDRDDYRVWLGWRADGSDQRATWAAEVGYPRAIIGM